MAKVQPISEQLLEELAKLFDFHTGSEIELLLRRARLPDPTPCMTKWKRLYNAFVTFQKEYHAGDHIINFIPIALSPVQYTNNYTFFLDRLSELNRILSFLGLEYQEDGKLHRVKQAEKLSDAIMRAQRLKSLLEQRNVHPDILKFADAEIISDNYFHAVLESMKSLTSKLREKSNFSADGAPLVNMALQGDPPCIAINPLKTESEKGEQRGFANLLIGLYGTFRNPVAHEAKIEWQMSEEDALDILSTLSLIHRKLDKAVRL